MDDKGNFLPHEPYMPYDTPPRDEQGSSSANVADGISDYSPAKSDISVSDLMTNLSSPESSPVTTRCPVVCGIEQVAEKLRGFVIQTPFTFPGFDVIDHSKDVKKMVRLHRAHCQKHSCGMPLHRGTGKCHTFVIIISMLEAHRDVIPDYKTLIDAIQSLRLEELESFVKYTNPTTKSAETFRAKHARYEDVLAYNKWEIHIGSIES